MAGLTCSGAGAGAGFGLAFLVVAPGKPPLFEDGLELLTLEVGPTLPVAGLLVDDGEAFDHDGDDEDGEYGDVEPEKVLVGVGRVPWLVVRRLSANL